MKTALLVGLLGVGAALSVGCGDDGASAGSNTSDVKSAPPPGASVVGAPGETETPGPDLQAAITTRALTKTSTQCTVKVDKPEIDARSPAATAAIAKVLPVGTAEDFCTGLDPADELSIEGGFTVTTNAHGILSVTLSEDSFIKDTPHPNVTLTPRVFDLKTGKLLKLADVLQPAGIAKVKQACVAALVKAEGEIFDEASATEECTKGLEDSGERRALFEIEPNGFHLMLDLAHAIFAIGVEGATVPWTELAGSVTPGAMADWVKAEKK